MYKTMSEGFEGSLRSRGTSDDYTENNMALRIEPDGEVTPLIQNLQFLSPAGLLRWSPSPMAHVMHPHLGLLAFVVCTISCGLREKSFVKIDGTMCPHRDKA